MHRIAKKVAREDGDVDSIDEEDYDLDEDWTLCGDPDLAYEMFTWLEAIEWKHLPNEGGLLDQPEILMRDIITILTREREFKEHRKVNEAGY